MPLDLDRLVAGLETDDGRHVERRRQVGDHGVQQRLHTLVLEGAATEYGSDLGCQYRATDRILEQLRGDRILVGQVGLHHVIVMIGDQLDQRMTCRLRLIDQVGRDLLDRVVLADLGLAAPGERAHLDQVDDTDEVRLRADRQLQRRPGWRSAAP